MEEYVEVNFTEDEFLELCAKTAATMIFNMKMLDLLDADGEKTLSRVLGTFSAMLSDAISDSVNEEPDAKNFA